MSRSEQPSSRRTVAALVGVAAVLGVAFAPVRAAARAPAPWTLRWEAPSECPAAEWVLKRVRSLQGSTEPRKLAAESRIWREGRVYRLRLVVRDDAGTSERTLDAPSCTDLAGAAAVHLALSLRGGAPPAGASSASTTRPESGASETSETTRQSASKKGRRPAARSTTVVEPERLETALVQGDQRRSRHLGIAAPMGVLDVGPLPKPGLGIGAALTVFSGPWQLAFAGEIDGAQRFVAATAPRYAAVLARQAGSASLCYAWRWSAVDLAPCASLWLEHVRARGEGPDLVQHTARVWWASPAAAVLARWSVLPPLALVGALNLRLEGARPHITVAGFGRLEQFAPVSLSISLATEWIF